MKVLWIHVFLDGVGCKVCDSENVYKDFREFIDLENAERLQKMDTNMIAITTANWEQEYADDLAEHLQFLARLLKEWKRSEGGDE